MQSTFTSKWKFLHRNQIQGDTKCALAIHLQIWGSVGANLPQSHAVSHDTGQAHAQGSFLARAICQLDVPALLGPKMLGWLNFRLESGQTQVESNSNLGQNQVNRFQLDQPGSVWFFRLNRFCISYRFNRVCPIQDKAMGSFGSNGVLIICSVIGFYSGSGLLNL